MEGEGKGKEAKEGRGEKGMGRGNVEGMIESANETMYRMMI
jgi:hypothetical protein